MRAQAYLKVGSLTLIFFFLLLPLCGDIGLAQENLESLSQSILVEIEEGLYGNEKNGALLERLGAAERDVLGKPSGGALMARLFTLRKLIFGPTGQDEEPSLLYKLNALEWLLFHKQTRAPLLKRMEALETNFLGQPQLGAGPAAERINQMLRQCWPEGKMSLTPKILKQWSTLSVKMLDSVGSRENKVGDIINYQVIQDVIVGDCLVIPAGAWGEARVKEVEPAGFMGKSGKIVLDFQTIPALDGTQVPVEPTGALVAGDKEALKIAAGVSMGMLLLLGNPVALVSGYFIRGRDVSLPAGTVVTLEVKEAREVQGLKIK